ncbi:MAG: class I SAM-dependent methyltransferase [Solirubrobacterales bacterium]
MGREGEPDRDGAGALPYPEFDLMDRVLEIAGDRAEAEAEYERLGADTKNELMRLLPEGWDPGGRTLLDFGCGAGRTLRHFIGEAESGAAEVWGADIDAASIDWLRASLCPPLNAVRCDVDPPLPFDDGSFDLIWAISVFTHLADNSADWLLELHRVLAPGGLLVATYMGEWNSERIAGEPWDESRVGMNVLRHDAPWSIGGPMILMSDWWVREHWGRAFEFVSVQPWAYNQTWPLLRKKDVTITPEELLAPADDPREIAALRHNVAQLQREIEQLRGDYCAIVDGVRSEYEGSRSWRLTRPLRGLGARMRGGR